MNVLCIGVVFMWVTSSAMGLAAPSKLCDDGFTCCESSAQCSPRDASCRQNACVDDCDSECRDACLTVCREVSKEACGNSCDDACIEKCARACEQKCNIACERKCGQPDTCANVCRAVCIQICGTACDDDCASRCSKKRTIESRSCSENRKCIPSDCFQSSAQCRRTSCNSATLHRACRIPVQSSHSCCSTEQVRPCGPTNSRCCR